MRIKMMRVDEKPLEKMSSRHCLPVMWVKLMMTGEVGLMRMMIRIQDNCFLA